MSDRDNNQAPFDWSPPAEEQRAAQKLADQAQELDMGYDVQLPGEFTNVEDLFKAMGVPTLEACPFCGSSRVEFSQPIPDDKSYDYVMCNKCGVHICQADLDQLNRDDDPVTAWNRRTPKTPKEPSQLTREELCDPDYMAAYVEELYSMVEDLVGRRPK